MTDEINPEKVEAYRCPVCDDIIIGDYEEATKHVKQPVHEELPIGLVYFSLRDDSRPRRYELVRSRYYKKLSNSHTPIYNTQLFMIGCIEGMFMSSDLVATLSFKEGFKEGKIRLLTQEELEKFCRLNPKYLSDWALKPVRTTPELEELVGKL